MAVITLIPAFVLLGMLFLMPARTVFIQYFVPLFLLLPGYYYYKTGGLPPITVTEACLAPMGIMLLRGPLRNWWPTRMDIAVALFVISSCVQDFYKGRTTIGYFDIFDTLIQAVVPYLIGKVFLEQEHLRLKFLNRMLAVLSLISVIELYEFKMGINPFVKFFSMLYPGELFGFVVQYRWGFGRVAGPFGQSELAGIFFLFGAACVIWITWAYPDPRPMPWFPKLPFTRQKFVRATVLMGLLTSLARGPWVGFLVALPAALIGRSKHHLRYLAITLFIGIPLAIGGLLFARSYVNDNAPPKSQEQENAQYRGRLLTNYVPIAKLGGAWGWGLYVPVIDGQDSIDNEFLLVWLHQGAVGLGSMVWVCAESLWAFLLAGILARNPRERSFAYLLFGIFAGILLTIATVFLGSQTFALFFLIVGWSQGLRRPRNTIQPRFEQVLA